MRVSGNVWIPRGIRVPLKICGAVAERRGRGGNVSYPFITFYLQAYNAEKYLEKCLLSIINQTEPNIELILVNNASTDSTGDICLKYAKQDSRIVYQVNEMNTVLHPEYRPEWVYPKGLYYTFIDADDYLDLDFVKVMYGKAVEKYADIVVCGTSSFNEYGLLGERKFPTINTTNMSELLDVFMEMYPAFRTFWGKIYLTKFYVDNVAYAFSKPDWLVSGVDTFAVLRLFKKCRTFASIDQPLHYYRAHEASLYNSYFSIHRISEADCLYDEAVDLLNEWGSQDEGLVEFLEEVHLASIVDTLEKVVTNQTAEFGEKIKVIEKIVTSKVFKKYAFKNTNFKTIFDVIDHCISEIEKDKDLFSLHERDTFVDKLHLAFRTQNDFRDADWKILLLAMILHSMNTNLWGSKLFETWSDDSSIKIFERLNFYEKSGAEISIFKIRNDLLEDSEEIRLLKSSMDENYSKKDYEKAMAYMIELTELSPLDREGLVVKLLLAWQFEDLELILNTLEVLQVFWSDDSEALCLCGDIFLELQLINRSLICYEKAIEITADSERLEEIHKRIIEINLQKVAKS